MQDKSDRYQYQPWYIKLWRRRYYLSFPVRFWKIWSYKEHPVSFAQAWSITIGLICCDMKWVYDCPIDVLESDIITIPPLPSVELDKNKLQEAKQKRGESLRPPQIKISDDILNKIKKN